MTAPSTTEVDQRTTQISDLINTEGTAAVMPIAELYDHVPFTLVSDLVGSVHYARFRARILHEAPMWALSEFYSETGSFEYAELKAAVEHADADAAIWWFVQGALA